MHPEYEAVIGLEVHTQLATQSKIFCACKARLIEGDSVSEEAVNRNTCPVCAGHPGTLPVLNKKAVEYAIRTGIATHCTVNFKSVFSRKNYFYPDLPKGYQISQFDLPICENGWIQIDTKDGDRKKIQIQRIHMEEDAGKNVHMDNFSLVNLNRAGVPLIEIVTAPDMRTPEEAGAYLRALYAIVTYLGVCDGNLQEGNFRCDANVSVMKKGSKEFGTRAEVKNVNSFRFVEKAIEYEITRQIELLESGEKVKQETRGYDPNKNITVSLRSKEDAHDYRYFPEPDLLPLAIEQSWIDEIKKTLPELPDQKRLKYINEFSLSSYDAKVLTSSKTLALFFEKSMSLLVEKKQEVRAAAKCASNLLCGEVSRLLNEQSIDINQSKLTAEHISDLVPLILDQTVSSTGAKTALLSAWNSGEPIPSIVEKEGLKQVSDLSSLEPVIDQILKNNPNQVEQFKAGKEKLLGFFVGQVMKETQGKANPSLLQEAILKKLKN